MRCAGASAFLPAAVTEPLRMNPFRSRLLFRRAGTPQSRPRLAPHRGRRARGAPRVCAAGNPTARSGRCGRPKSTSPSSTRASSPPMPTPRGRFAMRWNQRRHGWCHDRRDIGIFVDQKQDQKCCNLLPWFFDGAGLLHSPGHLSRRGTRARARCGSMRRRGRRSMATRCRSAILPSWGRSALDTAGFPIPPREAAISP